MVDTPANAAPANPAPRRKSAEYKQVTREIADVPLKFPRPRWWGALFAGAFMLFLLYLISARTAHRLAGYLAEQSVQGYSQYLERIESGAQENRAAPSSAIAYWTLAPDANISDMVIAMREDEAIHRDIHHAFADALNEGNALPDRPGPLM